MSWFWGETGYSLLDYWTLAHLAFWFFIGNSIAGARMSRWKSYIVCLVLALCWEVFEKFAEKKWPDVWQSPESWMNSFGSDLLTVGCALVAFWGYDKWRTR